MEVYNYIYLLIFLLSILFFILEIFIFSDILFSNSITLDLGFKTLHFSSSNPIILINLKTLFFIFSFLSKFIICNSILAPIFRKHKKIFKLNTSTINSTLNILLGETSTQKKIFINEKGLYQNILITGSIGSGKTSSAMYPITQQLIAYNSNLPNKKIGMLILDVKGNYYSEVAKYSKFYNRESDLIVIELSGKYKYNPLDNIDLKPSVIANRLKTVLLLFSPNNTESYWLDKVESILAEAIVLIRLYNNYYVTFIEIHKIITDKNYYCTKVNYLRKKFTSNLFTSSEIENLYSAINFFENEYFSLDSRTFNILKSEITRITNLFTSDSDIISTFCPQKHENTFNGFQDVIKNGKIVILNMNINEYRNLSKIIATYLKLDFQTEVLKNLSSSFNCNIKPVAFICDEYSEYVSATDANFFSQSRESKCINIISTQSYTSLLNALNNKYSTNVIIQNLVNKLWFRSDDLYTIFEAQKQIGKTDLEKTSKTISENANETHYNFLTNSLYSKKPNISESLNTYVQHDYFYDSNFFSQELHTFECLAFLSNGSNILHPTKLKMYPNFKLKEGG